MNRDFSSIIQVTELLDIYRNDDLVIVNAGSGKDSKESYEKKHLEGALYVDLNAQLSDTKKDASKGGRHPLPTTEQFSRVLSDLGISQKSHVVIYDHKNGANAAARFWWMLKAAGHEKVQVLNGGFQEAEKNGFPISSKKEVAKQNDPYIITGWKLPQADMDEVERCSQDNDHLVIDVREADRYNGLTEPIDLIAGHIPGAVNVPFATNLDANGLFRSPDELRKKYEAVFGDVQADNVIIHCGSGVTACHTLLALDYAGLEVPKLYVGSWSEWSRNDKEMVTKETGTQKQN